MFGSNCVGQDPIYMANTEKAMLGLELSNQNVIVIQTFFKTKINSEFNSIYFGIEINDRLRFLTPKNVWV